MIAPARCRQRRRRCRQPQGRGASRSLAGIGSCRAMSAKTANMVASRGSAAASGASIWPRARWSRPHSPVMFLITPPAAQARRRGRLVQLRCHAAGPASPLMGEPPFRPLGAHPVDACLAVLVLRPLPAAGQAQSRRGVDGLVLERKRLGDARRGRSAPSRTSAQRGGGMMTSLSRHVLRRDGRARRIARQPEAGLTLG
jgi:hypothetical protein